MLHRRCFASPMRQPQCGQVGPSPFIHWRMRHPCQATRPAVITVPSPMTTKGASANGEVGERIRRGRSATAVATHVATPPKKPGYHLDRLTFDHAEPAVFVLEVGDGQILRALAA